MSGMKVTGRPSPDAFKAVDQARQSGVGLDGAVLKAVPTSTYGLSFQNDFVGAILDPANKTKPAELLFDTSLRVSQLDYEKREGASYEDIASMIAGNSPVLVEKLKAFDEKVSMLTHLEGVGGITAEEKAALRSALKPSVENYPIYLTYENHLDAFVELLTKPKNTSRQASDIAIELWTHQHLDQVPQLSNALSALGKALEGLRQAEASPDQMPALLKAIDSTQLRPALASFRTLLAEALVDPANAKTPATDLVRKMLSDTVS